MLPIGQINLVGFRAEPVCHFHSVEKVRNFETDNICTVFVPEQSSHCPQIQDSLWGFFSNFADCVHSLNY